MEKLNMKGLIFLGVRTIPKYVIDANGYNND